MECETSRQKTHLWPCYWTEQLSAFYLALPYFAHVTVHFAPFLYLYLYEFVKLTIPWNWPYRKIPFKQPWVSQETFRLKWGGSFNWYSYLGGCLANILPILGGCRLYGIGRLYGTLRYACTDCVCVGGRCMWVRACKYEKLMNAWIGDKCCLHGAFVTSTHVWLRIICAIIIGIKSIIMAPSRVMCHAWYKGLGTKWFIYAPTSSLQILCLQSFCVGN